MILYWVNIVTNLYLYTNLKFVFRILIWFTKIGNDMMDDLILTKNENQILSKSILSSWSI